MRAFGIAFSLLLTSISFPIRAGDDFCGVKNTAFQYNEQLTFRVYYTLWGVYIGAGEANFTTSIEQLNGHTVYHIIGDGKTYSFYDNFFKVRDKYETYIDTGTLQPSNLFAMLMREDIKFMRMSVSIRLQIQRSPTKGFIKCPDACRMCSVPSTMQEILISVS